MGALGPWAEMVGVTVEEIQRHGSTDGSRELLHELGARGDLRLRVFFHEQNRGKSAALRTAIAAARGRITLIQDADLEYDPSDYAALIEPIVDGQADVVYGSRFLGNKRRVLLFWHTVGNRFLTLFSNVFTNLNLTDLETCYKAFRTELIQSIPLSRGTFRLRSGGHRQGRAARIVACTKCRSRTMVASTGKARRSAGRTACRRCG